MESYTVVSTVDLCTGSPTDITTAAAPAADATNADSSAVAPLSPTTRRLLSGAGRKLAAGATAPAPQPGATSPAPPDCGMPQDVWFASAQFPL